MHQIRSFPTVVLFFSDISSNFFRALSRYIVSDTSFFLFLEIDRFKARGGGSGGGKTFSDKSDDSWDVLLTVEINVALCSIDEKELFS